MPNTRDFTVTSDEDYIYTASYNGAYFYFDRPGKGNITVSGYGAQASFQAESTYVPVESIKLSLPSEVKMHHLVYSMGSGDNYMGVNQDPVKRVCGSNSLEQQLLQSRLGEQ